MTNPKQPVQYKLLAKKISAILTIVVTVATGFYQTTVYIVENETTTELRSLQIQILGNSKRSVDLAIQRIKDKDSLTNRDEVELETLLRERDLINKALQAFSQE